MSESENSPFNNSFGNLRRKTNCECDVNLEDITLKKFVKMRNLCLRQEFVPYYLDGTNKIDKIGAIMENSCNMNKIQLEWNPYYNVEEKRNENFIDDKTEREWTVGKRDGSKNGLFYCGHSRKLPQVEYLNGNITNSRKNYWFPENYNNQSIFHCLSFENGKLW